MNILKVNTLKLIDDSFPDKLKQIAKPPRQLFWRGLSPVEWLELPSVAIVGSRKASAYGSRVTGRLASELSSAGIVIISGLALGIDTVAHQAALGAKGLTVAVMGGGLDKIYPVANQALAAEIRTSGCLISEYPLGAPAIGYQFIARNRLISGLADVVVITEAATGSGSLHTAQFGLEQGKAIMAVPGPIDQPSYQGTNNLIKAGALPVTSAEDIFLALGLTPKRRQKLQRRFDDPAEAKIYQLLANGVTSLDELIEQSGLAPASLNSALTGLELNGLVRPAGGGQWSIN